jgi:hypothetical protein
VNPKAKAGRRGRRLVEADDFLNLGGNSRRLKEHEMFSRMYYKEKVQPIVNAELERLEAEGIKMKRGKTLSIVKKKLREVYDLQSDDIKAQVCVKLEEHAKSLEALKSESQDENSDRTPAQYLQ